MLTFMSLAESWVTQLPFITANSALPATKPSGQSDPIGLAQTISRSALSSSSKVSPCLLLQSEIPAAFPLSPSSIDSSAVGCWWQLL